MFKRKIHNVLLKRIRQFPVIALTGPRQSGKTTLLKNSCQGYDYINLESPDSFALMQNDPKHILTQERPSGLIIDEAQKFPELFSYIQEISDTSNQTGQFILSGSQNFLLNEQITQSLAGRVGLLELLPLTYQEYLANPISPKLSVWDWLFLGGYPRPYQNNIPINVWAASYVQTYIERDVRMLLNIRDLTKFQNFLKLCAGRHGQLLNLVELATDCGISSETANHWLSILEASYIVFRLPPYYKNFSKRLIKSKKLYFYDSSLVCYLLGIESSNHLSIHAMRGAIFEGYVLSEIKKLFLNEGQSKPLYFWRDSNGIEVDCLIENKGKLHAIEIKSTSTYRNDLIKNLKKLENYADQPYEKYLIYTGTPSPPSKNLNILGWENLASLVPSEKL